MSQFGVHPILIQEQGHKWWQISQSSLGKQEGTYSIDLWDLTQVQLVTEQRRVEQGAAVGLGHSIERAPWRHILSQTTSPESPFIFSCLSDYPLSSLVASSDHSFFYFLT